MFRAVVLRLQVHLTDVVKETVGTQVQNFWFSKSEAGEFWRNLRILISNKFPGAINIASLRTIL